MKRLSVIIWLVSLFVLCASGQDTYVLCVGVSSYADSNTNLSQATKDTKAFKAVMENHTSNITILTSKYANKDNMLEKLKTICEKAKSNDKIILFFSGHGYTGGIVTHDRPLYYKDINKLLSSSAAKTKICFIDACHSGSVSEIKGQNDNNDSPTYDNIIYMMSSRADENSAENSWVGHGYFTQALLKGLRGKADANNDKQITVTELFNYVYNDVLHTTSSMNRLQHPQLIGSKSLANAIVVDWN